MLIGLLALAACREAPEVRPPRAMVVSAAGSLDTAYTKQDTTIAAVVVTGIGLGAGDAAAADGATYTRPGPPPPPAQLTPGDTLRVAVGLRGVSQQSKVTASLTRDDVNDLGEDSQLISPFGDTTVAFRFTSPGGWARGKYTLQVMVDDISKGVREFVVR